MEPIVFVAMIWQGFRQYSLAHAAAVAAAVERHMTLPYRFIVLTDRPAPRAGLEVWPLPHAAGALAAEDSDASRGYPHVWAKLWLFSPEAQALAPRICYLDADTIVVGDLAPVVTYRQDAAFVGAQYALGKLVGAMFCLQTGSLPAIWTDFLAQHGPQDQHTTDQNWLRTQRLGSRFPCWTAEHGLYVLSHLDAVAPGRYTTQLPANARVIHPTGKTKPWQSRFQQNYPWVREHYICTD